MADHPFVQDWADSPNLDPETSLDCNVTPPTARKRPAATRTATRVAEPPAQLHVRTSIGADQMVQRPGERVLPVGVTHVVGWQPVCGEPRVRFVFPGCTLDDAVEVCAACAGTAVRRVPRQRRASTG
jgi:hypothetical protein